MRTALRFIMVLGILAITQFGAYSDEKHPLKVKTVTAIGQVEKDAPNAREKAIADALRNAVMSGVGAYVDATTIGQNYQIIRDDILVKASGFATLDSVESSSISDGILKVKIIATVSNVPLVERLRELGLTHEWKVGVFIPESYVGKPIPDPAAETSIIQNLLKAGFRVIDKAKQQELQADEAAKRAAIGDLASLRDIKREYDVDIFITGEAFAEYVDEAKQGGITFYRSRGRIEAKAYYTDTGELLSMTDAFADGLDQTESLSAKQCLKNLGKKTGSTLVEDILLAPAAMTPFVTVKISNIKSISTASEFQKALKDLPGVTQVKRDRYTSGTLELNVYVKSEYREDLPEQIENSSIAKRLGLAIDISTKTFVQGRIAGS